MGLSVSSTGEAGAVWTILRSMPGYITISLINLTAATTAHWNAPTPPPEPIFHMRAEVRVRLDGAARVRRVFTASPDVDGGTSSLLAFTVAPTHDGALLVTFEPPALHYWSLVVIETSESDGPEEGRRSSYA
jgi:dextranase